MRHKQWHESRHIVRDNPIDIYKFTSYQTLRESCRPTSTLSSKRLQFGEKRIPYDVSGRAKITLPHGEAEVTFWGTGEENPG